MNWINFFEETDYPWKYYLVSKENVVILWQGRTKINHRKAHGKANSFLGSK